MTSAQTVFELAIHLMDEGNEATGQADTNDTLEYKHRTIPILNVLKVECYPFSDTWQRTEEGKRPICAEVVNFTDPIGLDDGICQGVLPYGLAAHLLLGEDDAKASYFNQRYQELLAQLARGIPVSGEDIETLYGTIEFGQFAHW